MTDFTAVSTFTSVGGLDLGLERAGVKTVAQCEADPWRREILERHWPGIDRYPDVRDMAQGDEVAWAGRARTVGEVRGRRNAKRARSGPAGIHVDLLHGGFPCQDLSAAGNRAGLAGARSGLFYEFARIADAIRPTWLLVENVPGIFSSNDGRDFGIVLGTLAELGYGLAWRVLDARYFGVPQRRRRVFIVGHLGGDSRSALHALCEGCEGGPEARSCSWQESAARAVRGADEERYYVEDQVNGTLRANGAGGFPRTDKQPLLVSSTLTSHRGKDGGGISPEETLLPFSEKDVSPALLAHHKRMDDQEVMILAPTLRSHPRPGSNDTGAIAFTGGGEAELAPPLMRNSGNGPIQNQDGVMIAATLTSGSHPDSTIPGRHKEDDVNLVRTFSITPESGQGSDLRAAEVDTAPGLSSTTEAEQTDRGVRVVENTGVRRLTPVECERLMSWPDDWTAPEGMKAPDSRRYAACGDGVVANVAEWIGRRMIAVHEANQGA